MENKAKSTAREIESLRKDIMKKATMWETIRDHGCNDPFWPDGCNMNLIRNHIIYDKYRIRELCEESGMSLPEEYYIPTPLEVDNDYMAGVRQKARVRRLKQQGCKISRRAPEYYPEQMNLADFIEDI